MKRKISYYLLKKYVWHYIFMSGLMIWGFIPVVSAQKKSPIIKASNEQAVIRDGDNLQLNWKLDPHAKPDIYYVNIPHKNSKVTIITNEDKISFSTHYGKQYDLLVLLNQKDTCFIRISATEDPTSVALQSEKSLPDTIPFTLHGSRIYLQGMLNEKHPVNIQFDLGAGTSAVNKSSADKISLLFSGTISVSNTQGINKSRTSSGNKLSIGNLIWQNISLAEVGNMKIEEDLIIGNSFFSDKIVEIDYDKNILIIYNELPAKSKQFRKQPVFYEQHRPKFEVMFKQNGKTYSFWALFDTGREGTMLIGEDFTGNGNNWTELKELQMIKNRKIVRLDAIIGGKVFKDIVTNAADPAKPSGRPTLFGNQILSQFNVILDNRSGVLYLTPNSRTNQPYSDYKSYLKEIAK